MEDAAVLMRGIHKQFMAVLANHGVDFEARAGEIHGLLGENGAGKTTLMRILSGFYQPDAGNISLRGRLVRIATPRQAKALGVGMVHQHFRLVERFTVLENLLLGQRAGRGTATLRREIDALEGRFGLSVDPKARVWALSVGERQRVEILKVLYQGADLLILDEPTAVLTPQETEHLFTIVKRMAAEGKAVIFITHKLEEARRLCDRITVLRRGRVAGVLASDTATIPDLARLMVGRTFAPHLARSPVPLGQVELELQGISALDPSGRPALEDVHLQVRGGEILGVAGVAGNGQVALAEVVAGMRIPTSGRLCIGGVDRTGQDAAAIHRAGVAFVPEDRLGTGLCPGLGVAENLIMRDFNRAPFARNGLLQFRAIVESARQKVSDFDIRTPDVGGPVFRLSGGNMQKVVIARELSGSPRVIIASQPTRGLDVAATDAVYRILLAARHRGCGVLLISEDLDEVLSLSDRVAVMYRGRIAGIVTPNSVSREVVGQLMAGVPA